MPTIPDLFGIAMVIIGSTIEIEGRGATLLVTLSDQLGESLGPAGRWIFLAGAAGAVVGAWFVPILVLLLLNGRPDWVGERYRNRLPTTVALLGTLLFVGWIAWRVL